MGFVVGFTIITWLVVVIVAFQARRARMRGDGKDKIRKRSTNNEQ